MTGSGHGGKTVPMCRGARSVAALGILLALHMAGAQGRGGGDFEDLSRRAAAALDEHPEEAVNLYQKALAIRPNWSEGWFYLGAGLFETSRFPESRDALRKGLALEPRKGTPWAFLGMAEYELGDWGQALAHIQKGESIGLADRPAFVAAAHYRAALACLRLSDFALALEQLRPLVRAGNDSAPVIEALGLSALNLPVAPAALTAEQRPVAELAGRAAWAFVAERPEQASSLFDQLVSLYPLTPGVHYMRGAYLIGSDPAAAEEEFRSELRIAPSHVLSRVQLALLLMKRGEMENAVKLAGEAARLAPADALSQVTLGRALLSAGRTAEAIAALQTGEKLAPLNARTHFYLQQAYQRAGRDAEARKEQAEFNRLRDQQEPSTVREP